jgi:hypothetical protein
MAKYIIDTSSLLHLVRYYIPFDGNKILYKFFEQKLKSTNFVLLKRVFEECEKVSGGLVIKKLDFLKSVEKEKDLSVPDKKHIIK